MTDLSIIIPTFNEEEHLADCLEPLLESNCEIIVVDGGSTDSTADIATSSPVKFLTVEKIGRARQLNRGAAESDSDILLFLHADTIISPFAIGHAREAFARDPNLVGGSFFRFFESDSPFLRLTCHLANWRTSRWGIFLGDQGIVVRKRVFHEMRGFREDLPFGEDLDFSIRLRQRGPTTALQPAVLSSARRFLERGPLRQTLRDLRLTFHLLQLRKHR